MLSQLQAIERSFWQHEQFTDESIKNIRHPTKKGVTAVDVGIDNERSRLIGLKLTGSSRPLTFSRMRTSGADTTIRSTFPKDRPTRNPTRYLTIYPPSFLQASFRNRT